MNSKGSDPLGSAECRAFAVDELARVVRRVDGALRDLRGAQDPSTCAGAERALDVIDAAARLLTQSADTTAAVMAVAYLTGVLDAGVHVEKHQAAAAAFLALETLAREVEL